jgi:hypothetical protein
MNIEIEFNDPMSCNDCHACVILNNNLIIISEFECLLFLDVKIKRKRLIKKLKSNSEIHTWYYIRPQECIDKYGE